MRIYFDFETNGLLRRPDLKAHCMAWAIDDGETTLSEGPDAIRAAIATWRVRADMAKQVPTLVAHYSTGFDLPVLKRLFGLDWKAEKWKRHDTKVAGSLYDPEFSGTHSLADWGVRVRAPKDDYQERKLAALKLLPEHAGKTEEQLKAAIWEVYEPEMGTYCSQDVVSLRAIDKYQRTKYADEHDWSQALEMEHQISEVMAKQEHTGVWFDMEAARKLEANMLAYIAERTVELTSIIKPRCIKGDEVASCFNKDGTPSATAMKAIGEDADAYKEAHRKYKMDLKLEKKGDTNINPVPPRSAVAGCFSRVSFTEYDLDSRPQVIVLLQLHGWKPTEYTEKGNPKFTEDSITSQLGGVGKALAERFVAITRLGMLRGWMTKVRPDGRISAKAQAQATPTGRMRHSVVVNVPRPGTDWGIEMRSLFGADKRKGWWQAGADASGLELRMLAHYIGDPEFTKQVIDGDIHWFNAQLFGLVPMGTVMCTDETDPLYKVHKAIRNCEKTLVYALIYGAGDAKLGATLANLPGYKGVEAEGALCRERFMRNLPKYGRLMERIEETLFEVSIRNGERHRGKRKRQWLMGLDGRRLYVRHDHAALNTLLQSAGSIVVKAATVYADAAITRRGIDARQVIHMHDEAQYEGKTEEAARAAGLCFVEGIKWAAQKYKVRCPLDGEVKTGRNWAECH